jgi:hypothetical protein
MVDSSEHSDNYTHPTPSCYIHTGGAKEGSNE